MPPGWPLVSTRLLFPRRWSPPPAAAPASRSCAPRSRDCWRSSGGKGEGFADEREQRSAMTSALLVLACLMGAGGVGLAAAAAHGTSAAGLDSAAYLLLFHAIAVLAIASLARQELLWRPLGLVAMACFVAGGALFAGDASMRAFAGHRLFP